MKIAVLGATGRMGTAVIRLVAASSDCRLSGAATEAGHAAIGEDAGLHAMARRLDVPLTDSVANALEGCDVAIDFSHASATSAHIHACLQRRCGLVLGTTGLSETQQQELAQAATFIPVVYGRNMSVGVLVFTELTRLAARLLGPDADVEIIEAHHRNKVDAPSGTALQLGEAVAGEFGGRLEDLAVYDRFAARAPRRHGSIGFSSVRAGSIVGDHDVILALDEEIIELRHRALDRSTFARGALRAARWAVGRPAGTYGMRDVLGLDKLSPR